MKLIIEDDDGRKTVVPFSRDEISIGRREGNSIRLTERNVSRRHARLSRSNAHVFIEDLGSYNGVKVNGERIKGRAEIHEGDLIEIGDYNLGIQLELNDPVPESGKESRNENEENIPKSPPSKKEDSVFSAPTELHLKPVTSIPESDKINEQSEQKGWTPIEAAVEEKQMPLSPEQKTDFPLDAFDDSNTEVSKTLPDMPAIDPSMIEHAASFTDPTFNPPFLKDDDSSAEKTSPERPSFAKEQEEVDPGDLFTDPADSQSLESSMARLLELDESNKHDPLQPMNPIRAGIRKEPVKASPSQQPVRAAPPPPIKSDPEQSDADQFKPEKPFPEEDFIQQSNQYQQFEPESPAPSQSFEHRKDNTAIIRIDRTEIEESEDRSELPQNQQPRLVILTTIHAGQNFQITHSSVTLGRTTDNDFCVDHKSISRHHCRLYLDEDNTWKILDRGSANGVRVNGEDYGLIDLRQGDIIELGHVKIRFCEPGDTFTFTERIKKSFEKEEEATPASRLTNRINPVLASAMGAGVLGLALLAIFLLLRGGDREPTAESTEAGVHEDIDSLFRRAKRSMENERWDEANQFYHRILANEPSNSRAHDGLERVRSERKLQPVYNQVREAWNHADWPVICNKFKEIPQDSMYRQKFYSEMSRIHDGCLDYHLNLAVDAQENRIWIEALENAVEAEFWVPNNATARQIQTRAERELEIEEREREASRISSERRRGSAKRTAPRTKKTRPATTTRAPAKTSTSTSKAKTDQSSQVEISTLEGHEAYAEANRIITLHRDNLSRGCAQADEHIRRALRLGYTQAHKLAGQCAMNDGKIDMARSHFNQFINVHNNDHRASKVREMLQYLDSQGL